MVKENPNLPLIKKKIIQGLWRNSQQTPNKVTGNTIEPPPTDSY